MSERPQRRLAAIVAADVAGYTRLVATDEEGTLAALRAHRRELLDPLIAEHGGRVANTAGDSLLLEFPSAVEAARFGLAMQDGMARRNADTPRDHQVAFRLGIHVGDVVAEGADLLGNGVNIAARLEALSAPGGAALSDDAYRQVRDRVAATWNDDGEHAVKNMSRPIRVWRWQHGSSAAAPAGETAPAPVVPEKPSIAVLPFTNLSEDAAQSYFADGIAEDIITDLSKLSELFVISRNSSFRYRGAAVDVQAVGRELGVAHVLEGSVRRAGNRVRINAQLIDATTGGHLWAERYDGTLDDIFELQDDVTGRIVAALRLNLTAAEQDRLSRRPTGNAGAYDAYLRARQAYALFTHDGLRQAEQLYSDAIALDPAFADAYGGKAALAAFALRFDMFMRLEDVDRARESIAKALELDPANGPALGARAWLSYANGDTEAAIAAARLAVSADTNDASARRSLAEILATSGHGAEALALVEEARRLDPRPSDEEANSEGTVYFLNGKFEAAASIFADVISRSPDDWQALNGVIVANAALGRLAESTAAVAKRLALWPVFNWRNAELHRHFWADEVRTFWLDAMRRGGAPEWPFGYVRDEANRLPGDETRALMFGHTMAGRGQYFGPFELEIAEDGNWTMNFENGSIAGAVTMEGDLRCVTIEGQPKGRRICVPTYRNPDGTAAARNEYVFCDPHDVFWFSVVR